MSNDIQKADQIAHRAYTKLALLVHHARATPSASSQSVKWEKWFNLETPDTDVYKDHLRPYRTVSAAPPPSFEIQVLLAVPAVTPNQVLVYREQPNAPRIRIDPVPRFILLESWSLAFVPRNSPPDPESDPVPSTIYKHGIGLFRSVFTLLHVLPAYKLSKRLHRRNGAFGIVVRIAGSEPDDGVLRFGSPPSSSQAPLPTTSRTLPPLPHPSGALTLTLTHLTSPSHFVVDDLESVLSSRFFSDEPPRQPLPPDGPEDDGSGEEVPFTPTLVKNQARESLPGRSSTSASPRQAGSLPQGLPRMRTPSIPSHPSRSPGTLPLPLTMTSRQHSASDSASSHSHSHTRSREEAVGIGFGLPGGMSAAARVRKESTGSLRGGDLPSVPAPALSSSPSGGAGPLPIRRPQIVHPFKSSTLSTSSSPSPSVHSPSVSLRQTSPLALGPRPSLPPGRVPPSPTVSAGAGVGVGSLGSRMSSSPATGVSVPDGGGVGRASMKRYSSSFTHRYKDSTGGGSDVSPSGSAQAGTAESQKSAGTSFPGLGHAADEEDLSAFMQDASQPKPLGRHLRTQSDTFSARPGAAGQPHDRDRDTHGSPASSSSRGSAPYSLAGRTGATPESESGRGAGERGGQLLTSEAAVDAELLRMNAAFSATLDLLGDSARRRERTQSSPGPSPGAGAGARPRPYRESSLGRASEVDSPHRRAERISEVTEGTESRLGSTGNNSLRSAREGGEGSGSGIGLGLVLRPRPGSRADSIASEEVIGKLELDDDRRRSDGR